MPDVLLRRGSLALVRSPDSAGLFRVDDRGGWDPAGGLDLAEWRWVLVCVAPLALQVLGSESYAREAARGSLRGEPEQTALKIG